MKNIKEKTARITDYMFEVPVIIILIANVLFHVDNHIMNILLNVVYSYTIITTIVITVATVLLYKVKSDRNLGKESFLPATFNDDEIKRLRSDVEVKAMLDKNNYIMHVICYIFILTLSLYGGLISIGISFSALYLISFQFRNAMKELIHE